MELELAKAFALWCLIGVPCAWMFNFDQPQRWLKFGLAMLIWPISYPVLILMSLDSE